MVQLLLGALQLLPKRCRLTLPTLDFLPEFLQLLLYVGVRATPFVAAGVKSNGLLQASSLAIPAQGLYRIFLYAKTLLVQVSEVNLCRRIAALGGLTIPGDGRRIVGWHSRAFLKDFANVGLGFR